ncbi:MAG: RNA polymerase sigma factor [Porticoccaceae bacterium]
MGKRVLRSGREDNEKAVVLPFGAAVTPLELAFRECRPRLIFYLRSRLGSVAEAEDAAQIAFLRLWKQQTALRDDNIVSLIFVTARNIATDMLRSRGRTQQVSLNAPDSCGDDIDVVDGTQSPERSAAARHTLEAIPRLLDQLPGKCREAFVACKFEGLGYPEISERMGITESMVRKYVRRALAHCVSFFERAENERCPEDEG